MVAAAFYPRIVIGVRGMLAWYLHRKDPAPEGSAPYPEEDEDGEAKEDEFEKFVGRFSKGPVPGEERDKTPGKDNDTNER